MSYYVGGASVPMYSASPLVTTATATVPVMDPYSGVLTSVPKVSHQFAPAFSQNQAAMYGSAFSPAAAYGLSTMPAQAHGSAAAYGQSVYGPAAGLGMTALGMPVGAPGVASAAMVDPATGAVAFQQGGALYGSVPMQAMYGAPSAYGYGGMPGTPFAGLPAGSMALSPGSQVHQTAAGTFVSPPPQVQTMQIIAAPQPPGTAMTVGADGRLYASNNSASSAVVGADGRMYMSSDGGQMQGGPSMVNPFMAPSFGAMAATQSLQSLANPFMPRPSVQQGADGRLYVGGARQGMPTVQTSVGIDGRMHVNPSFSLPVPVSGTQSYQVQLPQATANMM
mmetsp:Transcript_43716/g.99568  ORF Transcript_43716/g.99568 Transcript_43716/m.99568 type:complete len:336 (-) Transcript_43716:84-1091(-)